MSEVIEQPTSRSKALRFVEATRRISVKITAFVPGDGCLNFVENNESNEELVHNEKLVQKTSINICSKVEVNPKGSLQER